MTNRLSQRSMRQEPADQGAIAILFALVLTVLTGFGAFAVDMGYAYAVKRQLSVVSDGAALAGAQKGGMVYKTVGGCGSALNSQIIAAAQANYAASVPQGGPASLPASAVHISCDSSSVSVAVDTSASLSTFLGGLFGIQTLRPQATATAEVFGARALGGLRPFTVCLPDAEMADSNPSATYQSRFGQHNAAPMGCNPTGVPGDWGYAGFDVGGSQQTLLCLIIYGYGPECGGNPEGIDLGAPSAPVDSAGNTGNSLQNSAESALDDLMSKDAILLPVAGTWSGTGNNGIYTGSGAIPVKLCGWAMPKNNGDWGSGTKGSCWNQALYDQDKSNWSHVSLVLQWQKVGQWVTSSTGQDAGNRCELGNATCVPALRLKS